MPRVRFEFHPRGPVDVSIDAPTTSSDGGLVLLRQLDEQLGLCANLAPLLVDLRDPRFTLHTRLEQLRQRVFQIAMGYEDQNDATSLRNDSVWKVACDCNVDEGDCLSSQPSLSRLEHAMSARAVVRLTRAFEDDYVGSLPENTEEIVLDLDSTEDPTHGQQPLSFFNAHYDSYMYFPLLVFDAEGRHAPVDLAQGRRPCGTKRTARHHSASCFVSRGARLRCRGSCPRRVTPRRCMIRSASRAHALGRNAAFAAASAHVSPKSVDEHLLQELWLRVWRRPLERDERMKEQRQRPEKDGLLVVRGPRRRAPARGVGECLDSGAPHLLPLFDRERSLLAVQANALRGPYKPRVGLRDSRQVIPPLASLAREEQNAHWSCRSACEALEEPLQ
jgi:hypothetical protein